jgi:hypothetical protein
MQMEANNTILSYVTNELQNISKQTNVKEKSANKQSGQNTIYNITKYLSPWIFVDEITISNAFQ